MILARITLPFPPSVNGLYNGGSNQQRFPSKKYKAWLNICPRIHPYGLDKIKITYRFFFPDNRARDDDNLLKAVNDYLVKQRVIIDDRWQVISGGKVIIPVGIDRMNPRVEITIEVGC